MTITAEAKEETAQQSSERLLAKIDPKGMTTDNFFAQAVNFGFHQFEPGDLEIAYLVDTAVTKALEYGSLYQVGKLLRTVAAAMTPEKPVYKITALLQRVKDGGTNQPTLAEIATSKEFQQWSFTSKQSNNSVIEYALAYVAQKYPEKDLWNLRRMGRVRTYNEYDVATDTMRHYVSVFEREVRAGVWQYIPELAKRTNVIQRVKVAERAGIVRPKIGDPRYSKFWLKCDLHSKAFGDCGAYDTLVNQLGGPRRLGMDTRDKTVMTKLEGLLNGTLEIPALPEKHGKRMYEEFGCRCRDCKGWKSRHDLKVKRKAEEERERYLNEREVYAEGRGWVYDRNGDHMKEATEENLARARHYGWYIPTRYRTEAAVTEAEKTTPKEPTETLMTNLVNVTTTGGTATLNRRIIITTTNGF